MSSPEEIARQRIQNIASQHGISASDLGNTPVTEVQNKFGKAVADSLGLNTTGIDVRQGSATYGQVVQISNGVVTPTYPQSSSVASQTTTAAPVEEDSDPGAYYEPEEEEEETKPPETQKPKNILSQSDLIDGVPNWVFIALLLCCSCTFMMFILLMLK